MKKELDCITKLNPDVRFQRIRKFLQTVKNKPEAQRDLQDWQMAFSDEVIKVQATHLAPIPVEFANVIILKINQIPSNSKFIGLFKTETNRKYGTWLG